MVSANDVQALFDFGLLNENGVAKLASLIRTLQSLGAGEFVDNGTRKRARPRTSTAHGAGRRGPKATFTASREDLVRLKGQGMTAGEIAKKYGVSMATVNLHLKKHGLTKPRQSKATGKAQK